MLTVNILLAISEKRLNGLKVIIVILLLHQLFHLFSPIFSNFLFFLCFYNILFIITLTYLLYCTSILIIYAVIICLLVAMTAAGTVHRVCVTTWYVWIFTFIILSFNLHKYLTIIVYGL